MKLISTTHMPHIDIAIGYFIKKIGLWNNIDVCILVNCGILNGVLEIINEMALKPPLMHSLLKCPHIYIEFT